MWCIRTVSEFPAKTFGTPGEYYACLYTVYNYNLKLNLTVSSYLLSCGICLTEIMSHDLYRPTSGVAIWWYPRNTQIRERHCRQLLLCVTPYITALLCNPHSDSLTPVPLAPRLKNDYSYIFSPLLCLRRLIYGKLCLDIWCHLRISHYKPAGKRKIIKADRQ